MNCSHWKTCSATGIYIVRLIIISWCYWWNKPVVRKYWFLFTPTPCLLLREVQSVVIFMRYMVGLWSTGRLITLRNLKLSSPPGSHSLWLSEGPRQNHRFQRGISMSFLVEVETNALFRLFAFSPTYFETHGRKIFCRIFLIFYRYLFQAPSKVS